MGAKILEMGYAGLRKVVSGGQDGVDRGALDAAARYGVSTGGWAPKGYRTCRGDDPSLAAHGLTEHHSRDYPPRTRTNVKCSDGTLIIASDMNSAGTLLTIRYCVMEDKPFHVIEIEKGSFPIPTPILDAAYGKVAKAAQWVMDAEIAVLNVAGNHKNPAYHQFMTELLLESVLGVLDRVGLVKKAV